MTLYHRAADMPTTEHLLRESNAYLTAVGHRRWCGTADNDACECGITQLRRQITAYLAQQSALDELVRENERLGLYDDQKPCWCHQCNPPTGLDRRMILCPDCGNKRCPKANDHRNECSGSNEPGQPGSAYAAPAPAQLAAMTAERDAALAKVALLREALMDAYETVQSWADYAPLWAQERHGLVTDLAGIRNALEATK